MADTATGDVAASDSEARNRVRAKLEPDEKVLWIGKPIPRIDPCAWFLGIFFGILLLGAGIEAAFRPETVAEIADDWYYLPVALLFVLIPFWDWWNRNRTLYFVSDRRAGIVPGSRFVSQLAENFKACFSFPRDAIHKPVVERASSNRVNIRFSGLGKGFVNLPSSDVAGVLAAFEKLTGEP